MKKILFLLLSTSLVLSACKDKSYQKYMANVPIYTDFEEFRSTLGSVKFESSKPIQQKGNIYFKDNYLFIIDSYKGIHVIDNTNPSSPSNIGYYAVTGITGMEIQDNYLYINSYVDLVVVDVSSILQPTEVGRVENVFETAIPEHDPQYPIAEIDPTKGIITGWEVEEFVSETEPVNGCFNCTWLETSDVNFAQLNSSGGGSSQGISGSITKFTLLNQFLYVMDGNSLKPFDLSNPTIPTNTNEVRTWRNVETLFSYNDHIFMGTTTGMLIYQTNVKNNPELRGQINHVNACDPVVVDGDYAYVTLRTGTPCTGQVNQLDVIDVTDYSNPVLKKSFNLNNPHGLGIINDKLFICDGTSGLKIFDATNPEDCGNQLIKKFKKIQATDIILLENVAMLIGDDGLYQYDISNTDDINEISKITFN